MWAPFQPFPTGDERYKLPSVKQFYWNLGQVKRGLLWSDCPYAEPDIESSSGLDFDGNGLELIVRNGIALSHRYPDFSPDEGTETFDRRTTQLHSNWLTGLTVVEHEVDSNCATADFLKAYLTWEHPLSYVRIFRDTAIALAFRRMREYDKFEGAKDLRREAIKEFSEKMVDVHVQLRKRHLEKLQERLAEIERELECPSSPEWVELGEYHIGTERQVDNPSTFDTRSGLQPRRQNSLNCCCIS